MSSSIENTHATLAFAATLFTSAAGGIFANAADAQLLDGTCTIRHVIDGDTLVCDGARVRLLLIDAPELDQEPYGRRAADADLVPPGSVVTFELEIQERDRYGRVLAHVRTEDGRLANLQLVRRGFAVVTVYPPNVRHVERFRAAQDSARAEGRGLWATDAFKCEPAEHRQGRWE